MLSNGVWSGIGQLYVRKKRHGGAEFVLSPLIILTKTRLNGIKEVGVSRRTFPWVFKGCFPLATYLF